LHSTDEQACFGAIAITVDRPGVRAIDGGDGDNLLASRSSSGRLCMKRPICAGLFVALAAFSFAPPAARANPDDFTKRLMGRAPGKGVTYACFTRAYDDAHLAAHPQQNVRAMMLLVKIDSEVGDGYNLTIGVNFRSRKSLFETSGDCAAPHPEGDSSDPKGAQSAHCAIPCDGGPIDVALKDNGSVLLTIPNGARVWRPGSINPNENVHGAFAADDKLFRLDRASLSQCAPVGVDKAEKAILLRN
jgi:hypothetical protein